MLLELQSHLSQTRAKDSNWCFFLLGKISRLLGLHPFSEFFFCKGNNEEMTKLKMLMKHGKTSSKSRIEGVNGVKFQRKKREKAFHLGNDEHVEARVINHHDKQKHSLQLWVTERDQGSLS